MKTLYIKPITIKVEKQFSTADVYGNFPIAIPVREWVPGMWAGSEGMAIEINERPYKVSAVSLNTREISVSGDVKTLEKELETDGIVINYPTVQIIDGRTENDT